MKKRDLSKPLSETPKFGPADYNKDGKTSKQELKRFRKAMKAEKGNIRREKKSLAKSKTITKKRGNLDKNRGTSSKVKPNSKGSTSVKSNPKGLTAAELKANKKKTRRENLSKAVKKIVPTIVSAAGAYTQVKSALKNK